MSDIGSHAAPSAANTRAGRKAGVDPSLTSDLLLARSETPRSERAVATGTPDVLYVSELVGPDVVNTMPEKTLQRSPDWRQDYNHRRPYSALGMMTPAAFAVG